MRTVLGVCVALALLALAGPTAARPFDADEMQMVKLAHDYWGRSPACPQGLTLIAGLEQSQINGDAGRALGCTIWLSRFTEGYFEDTCGVIAHEYGHLLGYSHAAGGVMDAHSADITPQCAGEAKRRRIVGVRAEYRQRRSRCAKLHGRSRKRCARRARAALRADLALI